MHSFLVVSLSALTIAYTQDLFSTDTSADDDSSLFTNNLDATNNLDPMDPFLLSSASPDSEQELSSCLSENSDFLSRRSIERVRARDGKPSCPASGQPFLFKGSDLSEPGTFDPLEDIRRKFEGLLDLSPENDRDSAFAGFINEKKCLPGFPYNLCCRFRDSNFMGLLTEEELANYLVCTACSSIFFSSHHYLLPLPSPLPIGNCVRPHIRQN